MYASDDLRLPCTLAENLRSNSASALNAVDEPLIVPQRAIPVLSLEAILSIELCIFQVHED